jgi:hypothetical protein
MMKLIPILGLALVATAHADNVQFKKYDLFGPYGVTKHYQWIAWQETQQYGAGTKDSPRLPIIANHIVAWDGYPPSGLFNRRRWEKIEWIQYGPDAKLPSAYSAWSDVYNKKRGEEFQKLVAEEKATSHPRLEVKSAYTQWFNVAEKGNAPNWQLIKVNHVVKWFRNPSDGAWWSSESNEYGPNNLTSPRAAWCDSLHPGCNFYVEGYKTTWTDYSYNEWFNVGESLAPNWQPIQVNHVIEWYSWYKKEYDTYGDAIDYRNSPKDAYLLSLGYQEGVGHMDPAVFGFNNAPDPKPIDYAALCAPQENWATRLGNDVAQERAIEAAAQKAGDDAFCDAVIFSQSQRPVR